LAPLRDSVDQLPLSALWLFSGKVVVPAVVQRDVVLDNLEVQLVAQGATFYREPEPALLFNNPWYRLGRFGANLRALAMFDRGWAWFEVHDGATMLCYRVRCLHGFVFCLIACLMALVFGFMSEGISGLRFGLVVFAVYGGNLAVSAFRVPAFFRRAVRNA
jgi:hypothetical protein